MDGIIYKATCKTTGLCYIGQTTKPLKQRAKEHWYSRKDGTKFHNALLEYGRNDFTWETIDTCDISKLDDRENYWISYYDSYENGLNEDKGIGFPEALRHPSDKMNKSRSKKMKKEWETNYESRCAASTKAWEDDERHQRMSDILTQYNKEHPEVVEQRGKSISKHYEEHPEARDEVSKRMKGNTYGVGLVPWCANKHLPKEMCDKISQTLTGRSETEEHKANISKGVREFFENNPEVKKAMSEKKKVSMKGNKNGAGNKGRKHSEKQNTEHAETMRGRHRVYLNEEHTKWKLVK